MNHPTALYRHGDVLVAPIPNVPPGATRRPDLTLAHGERSGHRHRIQEQDAAQLLEHAGTLYLQVTAPHATLVHEEHRPIRLPVGAYRVWMQREYTPDAIRVVLD